MKITVCCSPFITTLEKENHISVHDGDFNFACVTLPYSKHQKYFYSIFLCYCLHFT